MPKVPPTKTSLASAPSVFSSRSPWLSLACQQLSLSGLQGYFLPAHVRRNDELEFGYATTIGILCRLCPPLLGFCFGVFLFVCVWWMVCKANGG